MAIGHPIGFGGSVRETRSHGDVRGVDLFGGKGMLEIVSTVRAPCKCGSEDLANTLCWLSVKESMY